MCCIFTCCGWVIDLVQRLWTFTMSCCISSAVCCSLLTASMSGVALGYNYSLAEYIDLKETNVSVYLKRGIFDDEIADDMEWRRSGHQPVDGLIREDKLMTGESDESTSMRSGRRLDDSIYESNDKHNFEGSLMRLTAKPPDRIALIAATRTSVAMEEIVKPFERGSLDQLKAIQSAINMRKAAAADRRTTKESEKVSSDSRRHFGKPLPENALKYDIPPFQDFAPNAPPFNFNPHRQAVPDDQINQSYKWKIAKLPPQEIPKHVRYDDRYKDILNLPSPFTPRTGPVRPTKSKQTVRIGPSTPRPPQTPRSPEPNLPKSIDEEMESFKDKPLIDNYDSLNNKEDDFLNQIKITDKKTDEDYEDEIKGVPLRKKRNIGLSVSNSLKANISIELFSFGTEWLVY
nr:uncharacterized protein LOC117989009 [Maniola hyperantus]